MKCSIQQYAIENAPAYYALSYTWGTPTEKKEILLNGEQFWVQPNLESTLRHFRSKFCPFYLWADAICINQADNDERSHQVMLMGQIYEKARAVEAWLGEASFDSDHAMDFVDYWWNMVSITKDHTPHLKWFRGPNQQWEALTSLFERPWYVLFVEFPVFFRDSL